MTTNSYNQDVVVEKSAPPAVVPVTSASMESGIANTGSSWFERGYLPDWPVTGLPQAGSIFTSRKSADHQYQMASTYEAPNAVLIDAVRSNATVLIRVPTNYAALSFLTSSGLGDNVIQYVVRYGDQGSETGTFVSPNWYGNEEPAWVTSGRMDVTTFTHADLTAYNPRLYPVDVKLANVLGPVTEIGLSFVSGSGHTALFAVSGAMSPGSSFLPIGITGYNEDLVVEANAIHPGYLDTNTTATMNDGTANTHFTWFEQGYYPPVLNAGLPAAGSLILSESETNHCFALAPSYKQNNAMLIDSVCSNVVITLVGPASCATLSFLTASANGPVTNQCVFRFADGSYETNRFISPDWLAGGTAALTTHGRISVSTRLPDGINSDGPSLFAVDVPVASKVPLARILLSPIGAGKEAHSVVFAVSGLAPGAVAARPILAIGRNTNGQLTIHSTRAGRLQSCLSPGGTTSWREEGPISESLTFSHTPGEPTRFYRVVTP